ncbi:MAG: hypothetical protein FWG64_00920 [Firmicutes bacterium]|nr:hypothetical protein [Bacillota bacterium]
MNADDPNIRAWDLFLEDESDWLGMNAHKEKYANNNLSKVWQPLLQDYKIRENFQARHNKRK